jgi:predicted enzyme related to lactoylglutathione lyase
MQKVRACYVNVFVSDLDRSIEFYADVLGLELTQRDDEFGYASFSAGPIGIGLARVDTEAPEMAGLVGRHTGVGLGVADVEGAAAELESRGVKLPMQPSKQPWGGFMATFEDPDGNVFYLDQMDPH